MTNYEYNNLIVGDWVIFDDDTIFQWLDHENSIYRILLDGQPHMIIRAGIEGGYHRIGFEGVQTSYENGWSYVGLCGQMHKVPAKYLMQIVEFDDVKKGDIIFMEDSSKNIFPAKCYIHTPGYGIEIFSGDGFINRPENGEKIYKATEIILGEV